MNGSSKKLRRTLIILAWLDLAWWTYSEYRSSKAAAAQAARIRGNP